jgi:glycosyltransferase involved in cell wall biosynthesis
MKIALLTPTFSSFSGIDRVVELQSKDLIQKGNEVTIFTLKADMKVPGVKIVVLGMPKNPAAERIYRLFFFLDRKKVKRGAKLLKPFDVAISHFYPMNVIAAYANKKYEVRYIYHNHGVAFPHLFRNPLERVYMKLFKYFTNRSIKRITSAVSISDFLRKELKRETGINSVIEYDHIDREKFHEGIDSRFVRNKFNLNDDPICLYVGRISPHKGIDLLIKAFNKVLKKIPNAKLIIVGKPTFDKYFKELKKIANENVIFAGFVPDEDLPYYYSSCDVYTTATLWEGFNMTVVEAQSCGKPVVAFDVGPHKEVVKNGLLVKPKNIEKFTSSIISLLNEKNEKT